MDELLLGLTQNSATQLILNEVDMTCNKQCTESDCCIPFESTVKENKQANMLYVGVCMLCLIVGYVSGYYAHYIPQQVHTNQKLTKVNEKLVAAVASGQVFKLTDLSFYKCTIVDMN